MDDMEPRPQAQPDSKARKQTARTSIWSISWNLGYWEVMLRRFLPETQMFGLFLVLSTNKDQANPIILRKKFLNQQETGESYFT
jgi:hypothetical protein